MPTPDHVFPMSEVDQNPNSVSLSTLPNNEGNTFWNNYFANGAASSRAPVQFNTTNADAARTWQQQMIQDLQQAAAGNPNSRAQQGLQAGYADARAGQSALGSSMRGTGGGAGLRVGATGAGNVQRGYEGDKSMLMNQEKEAAQALLAQQLAQVRATDAAQAQAMAANALGNQSLDDNMRQFYTAGGIGSAVSQTQTAADRARASMGFDLEGQDLRDEMLKRYGGSLATAGATAASFYGKEKSGGYRQVDGQDSIVPDWDK